jgi:hypothetical protein
VPKAPTAVQRPDAIVREKDGVAGFWRNDRKEEKKEEAMLRVFIR